MRQLSSNTEDPAKWSYYYVHYFVLMIFDLGPYTEGSGSSPGYFCKFEDHCVDVLGIKARRRYQGS